MFSIVWLGSLSRRLVTGSGVPSSTPLNHSTYRTDETLPGFNCQVIDHLRHAGGFARQTDRAIVFRD